MWRRLERHPAKSKPDCGAREKNKRPDERDIRQSVVNRLERRSNFGKGEVEKHHCCDPNHLETNQENSCALNTRERPASLQHSTIKPALVPSRLKRQNIFLFDSQPRSISMRPRSNSSGEAGLLSEEDITWIIRRLRMLDAYAMVACGRLCNKPQEAVRAFIRKQLPV